MDKCMGFALMTGKRGGIALLEASSTPFFDQKKYRMVKTMADRMLKIAISRWDCAFWRDLEEDEVCEGGPEEPQEDAES